jgi:U3 small nucleolar RNA-associated protein 19
MMAFNGLFILITNYGLEYPSFSNNLYTLLQPCGFVSRHHVQFFEAAFLVASSLKD